MVTWDEYIKNIKKLKKTLTKSRVIDINKECSYNQVLVNFQIDYSELILGSRLGVDSSTVKLMDSGNYQIDAVLDLHGYSIENAYAALENFILSQYRDKSRMLIIITGKGKENSIRSNLPHWLNSHPIRSCVLRFNYAHRKHGEKGAFYVLLKRVKQKC